MLATFGAWLLQLSRLLRPFCSLSRIITPLQHLCILKVPKISRRGLAKLPSRGF